MSLVRAKLVEASSEHHVRVFLVLPSGVVAVPHTRCLSQITTTKKVTWCDGCDDCDGKWVYCSILKYRTEFWIILYCYKMDPISLSTNLFHQTCILTFEYLLGLLAALLAMQIINYNLKTYATGPLNISKL